MHAGASGTLLKWREAEIIELIPPITPPPRPHLLVIEPHMDDAVLSVGGRLLHRRGRCRTTILSVAKWSNFTSYFQSRRNFLDVREVTELRLQESALAARLLGAEYRCLNGIDSPLRFWPAEHWSLAIVDKFNRNPQAFVNTFPDPKEVSLLAEQLVQELSVHAPDELWIPMGLGNHVDHRTTRSACLLMLAEARNRLSGVPVFMYEELPYAAMLGHAAQIRAALSDCGTRVVRGTEDITDVFEDKLRAVSVFASQFKVSAMAPGIRRVAAREACAEGKLAEAYCRLEGEVRLPLESRLSFEWAGLATLGSHIRELRQDKKERRRLTVIALPSGSLGKWKRESASLAAAFPTADIRVYAPESMAWQTGEGGDEKLRVDYVPARWRAWASVIWREFFHFGTPSVVLWRGAYGAAPNATLKKLVNTLIRSLLPFRRALLTRSLWDLCYFLNEQPHQDRVPGRRSAARGESSEGLAHSRGGDPRPQTAAKGQSEMQPDPEPGLQGETGLSGIQHN
jgi:LmbE family N-acetylglucosaminyl deacetylase